MTYRFADSLRAGSGWNCVPSWSCSQADSKPVWHIPLLCVQWKTLDDGQRNCPKYVDLHSKNKFEKLVPLVAFYYKKIPNSSFLRREESCEISAQPMWNADTCPCERMNLTVAQTYDNGDIDKYSCPCVTSGFRREVEGTALLWVITQRVVVIHYRRFGTT